MEEYCFNVNGLDVNALYDKYDIETVYKPLLEKWYQLYKDKKCRIIVYLVGCPGSGKSTFVSFLEFIFNQIYEDCKLQSVGMDGFHYYNDELDKLGLKSQKGSFKTFDVLKLKNKIIQTKKEDCDWPVYSRNIHNPIEDSIHVSGDIILLEGNYLLSEDSPWSKLIDFCDDTLFLDVDVTELKDRLINRKIKGKMSRDEAEQFYDLSDSKNIEYVLKRSRKSNLYIHMSNNIVLDTNVFDKNR